MKIIITEDYEKMSIAAADFISQEINRKPNLVLGLATGSTPLKTYEHLIKKYEEGKIDFASVTTFNLDEYIGVKPENQHSYHYYMNKNLFDMVNVKKENINIPNGNAEDIEIESAEYEKKIEKHGGIDLQILGIGRNGHIGFNEPDNIFSKATGPVRLKESTIQANTRFFERKEDVPTRAISMGIRTIMQSEKILLLASGEKKANAIAKTICGEIDPHVPASVLQLHRDVTIIIDKAAAAELEFDMDDSEM